MAIILSEEKKSINWLSVSTVILIVGFVLAAAYYFFIKRPDLVEIVPPPNLKTAGELSKIKFEPSAVIDSPEFKKLRQYAEKPKLGNLGKTNLFAP